MERLTNTGTNGEIWITDNDETRRIGKKEAAYKKLKAYEDAEDQGLILRLPCKEGDVVYAFLSTYNYFAECQINKIELKPTLYGDICYFLEPIAHRGCLYRYFEDEFGKTIFIKREEAEAKLKEMEGIHE